jgi:hypothetical protein
MRRRAAVLTIIFLIMLAPLTAYSLFISIAAVDPAAAKPAMEYFLGKNSIRLYDQNEVRSVSLSLSGATVSGATVQFYKRTAGTYYVRTTVTLLDAGGNAISAGAACAVYDGTGLRTATVTFSPAAPIEEVYRVSAVMQRVEAC